MNETDEFKHFHKCGEILTVTQLDKLKFAFKCSICREIFANLDLFNFHLEQQHWDELVTEALMQIDVLDLDMDDQKEHYEMFETITDYDALPEEELTPIEVGGREF